MAGGQERTLRRRIRSVESTKKITRAMELIAASQIVRAQGRLAGARPYLRAMEDVMRETASDSGDSRLLGVPENPENELIVAIVADRGLCGAYNSNVLRATERRIAAGSRHGRATRVVTVGKKAESYLRFRRIAVESAFRGMSDRPNYENAREVAQAVVPAFTSGEVDVVQLVSTRFVSAGTQVVETRQLLPVLPVEPVAPSSGDDAAELYAEASAQRQGFFEFEPGAESILQLLVPRYAEAEIFVALLEASASEHTARQRAMAAATDNAEELIKTLRRVMNRARQDAITTEIMEIVGGAEALRAAAGRRGEAPHRDQEQDHPEEQSA
jgi:F-type H+-transporting ATPase subunit gamma